MYWFHNIYAHLLYFLFLFIISFIICFFFTYETGKKRTRSAAALSMQRKRNKIPHPHNAGEAALASRIKNDSRCTRTRSCAHTSRRYLFLLFLLSGNTIFLHKFFLLLWPYYKLSFFSFLFLFYFFSFPSFPLFSLLSFLLTFSVCFLYSHTL